MENRSHALMAGFFILFLGLALAGVIWWFSQSREPMKKYELVSRGSVSGLNVQAQVRFRGMPAGQVDAIRLDPDDPRNLLVEISMREDLPVTRGTKASLGVQGVTGVSYVQLDDNGEDPTPLQGKDGHPPRLMLAPSFLDQLADGAMDVIQRFREVTDRFTAYFDDETMERVHAAVASLQSAADGIDRTFGQTPATMAAINSVFSDANMRRFSNTLANLERVSADTAPVIAELRETMGRIDQLVGSLDHAAQLTGNSIMRQTLPHLNRLLEELTNTSLRMGRLIEEVESSPQMLITGRSKARPGPGESGFAAERQ